MVSSPWDICMLVLHFSACLHTCILLATDTSISDSQPQLLVHVCMLADVPSASHVLRDYFYPECCKTTHCTYAQTSASTAVRRVFKLQATGAGASELAVSTLRHLMHPFGPSTVWQAIHGMFCISKRERVSAVSLLFALLSAIVPINQKLESLSPASSATIKLHLQTQPLARK